MIWRSLLFAFPKGVLRSFFDHQSSIRTPSYQLSTAAIAGSQCVLRGISNHRYRPSDFLAFCRLHRRGFSDPQDFWSQVHLTLNATSSRRLNFFRPSPANDFAKRVLQNHSSARLLTLLNVAARGPALHTSRRISCPLPTKLLLAASLRAPRQLCYPRSGTVRLPRPDLRI